MQSYEIEKKIREFANFYFDRVIDRLKEVGDTRNCKLPEIEFASVRNEQEQEEYLKLKSKVEMYLLLQEAEETEL